MTTAEQINKLIAELSEEERNKVSDGHHTFCELYEHRCVLFVAFVNLVGELEYEKNALRTYPKHDYKGFKKSKTHFDGTSRDGRFIVQGYIYEYQISYHLPMKHRDNIDCEEVAIADERDGHTSQDVLDRLLLV